MLCLNIKLCLLFLCSILSICKFSSFAKAFLDQNYFVVETRAEKRSFSNPDVGYGILPKPHLLCGAPALNEAHSLFPTSPPDSDLVLLVCPT
jgi:hypothetical protein